jgi:protein SCO1/2
LTLLALAALPGVAAADRRADVAKVAIEQRLNEQVPLALPFVDDEGRAVTLGDYFKDRPVILVLAYYRCPRLCSLVLNKLVEALRRVDYTPGKEFEVVVVSIDPTEDWHLARAKKAAYVDAFGRPETKAGWHFLTGKEAAIERLADAVGFRYFWDEKVRQYAHASGIMVVTPRGKLARYFYGLDYPAGDLQSALKDAAAQRIGAPVTDPLRMLCFDYDPETGQYTLQVMRLVRLAGAVTVVAIVGLLWWHWWRERRKARAAAISGTPVTTEKGPG